MLRTVYPQHCWNMNQFGKLGHGAKSAQKILVRAIQQLFPTHGLSCKVIIFSDVEEDYKHPDLIHPSGNTMELDVFIKSLSLAVEYQGEQHYSPQYWTGNDLAQQKKRDKEKREACVKVNLKYAVP